MAPYTEVERGRMVVLFYEHNQNPTQAAIQFAAEYPNRPQPCPKTISRTVEKFKTTSKVTDKPRTGIFN